jgi:signal transduction histidine kinase
MSCAQEREYSHPGTPFGKSESRNNNSTMPNTLQLLKRRQEPLNLVLMLEFLHFSIWLDFGSPLSRSFMLIHLGLFLIWQPVWKHDEQISWFNSLVFILLTLTFVTFMNWTLLFGWLILLSGFAGGRIIVNRNERATYMNVLTFLITELIIQCTPGLFAIEIQANVSGLFEILLPFLPLLIVFLPVRKPDTRIQSVDLQHALATSTMITLLIFGSLLNMYIGKTDYMLALIQALLAIATFLFAISWLVSPRVGFSALSQLWSRALLNIGTPFERWLEELARISQQQQTPEAFLEMAMEELVSLPWVNGVGWRAGKHSGANGTLAKHMIEFRTGNLEIDIYTYNPVGAALYHHCNLLVQVIEHFYMAKIRERKLTHQAHLQAIHETGARVTHDIKNLLQSLQAITAVLGEESGGLQNLRIRKLVREQMPHLGRRLQLALDKLIKPAENPAEFGDLTAWWENLRRLHTEAGVALHAAIDADTEIPVELFDSVTENLLENIRDKTHAEGPLRIEIDLIANGAGVRLEIRDNGGAIAPDKAELILREPMDSESGLGIGLYQAARLAESLGYVLELDSNRDGAVSFVLRNG